MPPRFGLVSIRERVPVMGGTLLIDCSPEPVRCVTLAISHQAVRATRRLNEKSAAEQ